MSVVLCGFAFSSLFAQDFKSLPGHVPAIIASLKPISQLPGTNPISLALGLPLRNQAELDDLLGQLYDPQSPNFHRFLRPDEFASRFGPTEQEYESVAKFAQASGLVVRRTHPNRLVLDVEGSVANVERAFHVSLHLYKTPAHQREFFAPDADPSVPVDLPVADMWGLSDYGRPTPLLIPVASMTAQTLNYNGSGPGGAYQGADFRHAYAPGTTLAGIGQTVAVAEFDGYYPNDITNYEAQCGYTNVPVQNVIVDSVSGAPGYSGLVNAVAEVSLDIELAIAMAPGLTKLMVYEGSNPYDVFNQIATDNIAKQISSSWSWGTGPTHKWLRGHGTSTLDSILSQMVAQGQAFFQASGDSDAYTGSQALNSSTGPIPMDSVYVTSVGGTSLTMNGAGSSWSSETVWNWGNNVGSSGGISPNYAIPSWQANVSMSANSGSTVNRNIPDVALTADAVSVVYSNGLAGAFGGTSCAAPLWAGFTALINQQSLAMGATGVGFLNPALYAIAAGPNYPGAFHDITAGNNIGNNTPGLFNAVTGYDLATGLGTPNGTNLINLLAPPNSPYFVTQPASRSVTNGASVTFSASLTGKSPLSYQWLCNGTNLPTGGNVSGTTSNVLSITSATTNNAGSYSLIVTNSYGVAVSSLAVLSVGFAPALSGQPGSLTILSGSNAVFTATATGSLPLAFQWRKNNTNLVNGAGVSGATSNVLTLTAITTNSSGNYSLFVTNNFGLSTSSVAALTVVLPPGITSSSLTNRLVECGSNVLTFAATASGTVPLRFQWSLDGVPISSATNTSLSLSNLHLPNHTVDLVVTNLYGSTASNVVITVHDTLPPLVTLNGGSPISVELGSAFSDPGATATDICAGPLSVSITGVVATNVIGTNTVTYMAGDGSGNTGTVARVVIVRDTTPPTILWSFTNLMLAANANCAAAIPDLTGTNFVLATDLSGPVAISQNPTNQALLPLGTNMVVLTVTDVSSNAAYSTNIVVVTDQTPPAITLSGGNLLFTELGGSFTDPGATAYDNCAGSVSVRASGVVNSSVVGTNLLVYTADDGAGNTNTATRTVVVRDTTPPAILWSFTNLIMAADTNCVAAMPDITTTNFILAADLSGPLTISQMPTNGAILPIGTNLAVIAVADVYGNTTWSTNSVVVQDQAPPLILSQSQSVTNTAGSMVSFTADATACTTLDYQWLFNGTALANQTNNALTIGSVSSLNAGNYLLVVQSSGGSATSLVATLTVDLIPTILALISSNNPSGYKDNLNFAASITPAGATGTVQFLTNGVAFDQEPLIAGLAVSTNIASLPRGTNLITAAYFGDASYLPATNLLAEIITNHPPAAASASYIRAAGSGLDIAIADLATNWTDADGDLISLVDVGVSTNGVTLADDAGVLVYSNTNNVEDQFICTITDGWGGNNFQTVNIAIALPADLSPKIIGAMANPDGSFSLNVAGAPGHTDVMEATTDPVLPESWAPLLTNTLGTNGTWQFTDTQATNFPRRFYRVEQNP